MATFADAVRDQLTYKLEIAWDGATWTDESSYLVAAHGSEKIPSMWDVFTKSPRWQPTTATFTLVNVNGRYDPDNASTVVGLNYGIGMAVRLQMSIDGGTTWTPAFYGEVDQMDISTVKNSTIDVHAIDRSRSVLQSKFSTSMYTDVTPTTYLTALAGLGGHAFLTYPGTALPNYTFSYTGGVLLPFAWMDNENLMDEIMQVMQAVGGYAYFDRSGYFKAYGAQAFILESHLRNVQATFSVTEATEQRMKFGWEELYNSVSVEYSPRARAGNTLVYTLQRPFSLSGGEVKTIAARFRFPVTSITSVEYNIVDGGGNDVLGYVNISRTDYAQHTNIQFWNTSSSLTANVVGIKIYGNGVIGRASGRVTKEYTSAVIGDPAQMKKQLLVRSNPYIQSSRVAEAIADMLAYRSSQVRRSFNVAANMLPDLEIHSLVNVTMQTSGNTYPAYVTGVDWTLSDTGYNAQYHLTEAAGWFAYTDSPSYFDILSVVLVDKPNATVCFY